MGQGGPAGRYVFRGLDELHQAIAQKFGIKPENVVTGCGSTQILRAAVQMFTSPTRPLVAGELTYEECAGYAELIGTPVRAIPLDAALKLDLDAMAQASKGAGVVFLNNPNNPTATLHGADAVSAFMDRVLTASPDTTILIDEAYHDYVTDPAHKTQIPAALKNPRVIVARTFSKAHGMAGMRLGYGIGHPETMKKLDSWEGPSAINVASIVVGAASIRDQARLDVERDRNTQARQFTIDWFKQGRLRRHRLPDQLPLRQHQAAGEGVPRRVPGAGRSGGPRLPALREIARPDLDRDARPDEAGGGRLREGARGQGEGGLSRLDSIRHRWTGGGFSPP